MTVEELDGLCEEFIKAKEYEKKAEERMKEIKQATKDAQAKVIAALEEMDKTENEGSFGKVKVVQKEYYKCVDKQAAYNWLRERGEFDDMASINANTLSSHIKGLVHEKHEEGQFDWLPPGIHDATSDYQYLRITKK